MLKKIAKTTAKLGLATLGGLAVYHTKYNKKYPLVSESHAEQPLSSDGKIADIDWVLEENYKEMMTNKVEPFLKNRLEVGNLDRGDYSLAYEKFLLPHSIASVIIVHGFNEYKEKFHEVVYYFLQKNIQVFIYDQRGHGMSKLSAQQTQIDSQNFNEYVLDLKAMIDEVVKPSLLKEDKLFIFSHSMGGAVTTSFIEQFEGRVDGVILNTPMFLIDTGKYPRSFTYLYSKQMAKLGWGREYIPTTEAFDSEKHTRYDKQPENSISNSQIREAYHHDVNVRLHTVPTRGGSLNWLKTAFDTTHAILKPDRLKRIKQPVLLIRAGRDTVVQKEGIFTAGTYLPNVEQILIAESKHQTYLNHDAELKIYMSKLLEFIQQNAK